MRSTAQLALAVVLADVLASSCTWDWDGVAPPPPVGAPGAWIGTFAEECSGTTLDRSRWNTMYVYQDTMFHRYDWSRSAVDHANVAVADGLCTIRVENRPFADAPYTSGVLDSSNKFEQDYGFFEARVRVPAGVGFGTLVTLSWTERWHPRIDIVAVDGATPTLSSPTVWYDDGTGVKSPDIASPIADASADFHVYGVDVSPERVVFYQDGAEVGRLSEPAPFLGEELRFEITTHVGAEGSDGPNASTPWPARLDVDYVRAWRRR